MEEPQQQQYESVPVQPNEESKDIKKMLFQMSGKR